MKSNNTIFRELLKEHGLTRQKAADLLLINVSTVDRYLTPATIKGKPNPTHRHMSDGRLDHFKQCLERDADKADEGAETQAA